MLSSSASLWPDAGVWLARHQSERVSSHMADNSTVPQSHKVLREVSEPGGVSGVTGESVGAVESPVVCAGGAAVAWSPVIRKRRSGNTASSSWLVSVFHQGIRI